MTINGAIMELVMLCEHPMMPNFFKPSIQKVVETISEAELVEPTDTADTPQTDCPFKDVPCSCGEQNECEWHTELADTPQTDCETCKHYNPHHEAIACERCLDGKYDRYEPQTDCGWGEPK